MNSKPVKPGVRTTKFFLSAIAVALSVAYSLDLIPESGPGAKAAGVLAASLAVVGYSVSRSVAKRQ